MRINFIKLSCYLLIFGNLLMCSNVLGKEYVFQNTKKDITLIYSVVDGFKINIKILNIKNKEIYHWGFEADYGKPKVVFYDINADSFEDIILKLSGEGEYDLVVLVNVNNDAFVEGLPESRNRTYIFNYDYFNKNLSEKDVGNKKEFYLKDTNNDGINELVFHHLFIDGKIHKSIIFYFDKPKKKLFHSN